MPAVTCPFCRNSAILPEPWTAPGYTCPHCGATVAIALPPSVPVAPTSPPSAPEPAVVHVEHGDRTPNTRQTTSARSPTLTDERRGLVSNNAARALVGPGCFVATLLVSVGAIWFALSIHDTPPTETNKLTTSKTNNLTTNKENDSAIKKMKPQVTTVSSQKETKPDQFLEIKPAVQEKKWPYQFVQSKTEQTGHMNVMDLYAFSGNFDLEELKAFCRERKKQSPAKAFYFIAIFDSATEARFPSSPFTAHYDLDDDIAKHIRAIYTFNKLNGFSELQYHEKNIFQNIPNRDKI